LQKRTTTKIFARAKNLSRNQTPAEIKLWARLRAHRMAEVHISKIKKLSRHPLLE